MNHTGEFYSSILYWMRMYKMDVEKIIIIFHQGFFFPNKGDFLSRQLNPMTREK